MTNSPVTSIVAILVDDLSHPLNLAEVSKACRLAPLDIEAWVREGIIEPSAGTGPADWLFGDTSLRRALVATRLIRDLEVAQSDLALMLDLLDEIHRLHSLLGHIGLT
jgi:hypothetical protein